MNFDALWLRPAAEPWLPDAPANAPWDEWWARYQEQHAIVNRAVEEALRRDMEPLVILLQGVLLAACWLTLMVVAHD